MDELYEGRSLYKSLFMDICDCVDFPGWIYVSEYYCVYFPVAYMCLNMTLYVLSWFLIFRIIQNSNIGKRLNMTFSMV